MSAPPDVFRAVAHPSRRAILEFLAGIDDELGGSPVETGELAAHLFERFRIMPPTTSKHLAVLVAAGLVEVRTIGNIRSPSLRRGALAPLLTWAGEIAAEPAPPSWPPPERVALWRVTGLSRVPDHAPGDVAGGAGAR